MTRGERVCAFVETYCVVPEGRLRGQVVRLMPWQRRFILAVYDNPAGTTEGILSIARKNGKTSSIACLLLAHIAGPEAVENSQIVSGARSREQAGMVWNYAAKMVAMSPELSSRVRSVPSGKRLIGLSKNVEYKALSAEAKTAHGLSPILVIQDELGQVVGPSDDFADALETAQGAYDNPLRLVISTQAASDADLLSIKIDDAVKSADPHIVCHVYEAPKDADLMDRNAWVAANPALGVFRSEADLADQARRASRMPSDENKFRNLCLNQRVSKVSPFVSVGVWKECGAPVGEASGVAYGGLDLSAKLDLTAFLLTVEGDGFFDWHLLAWTPAATLEEREKRDKAPYSAWVKQGILRAIPGKVIDYRIVAEDIAAFVADYDVQSISVDPWKLSEFMKAAEDVDVTLPLVKMVQGQKTMTPAIDATEAALVSGQVRHGMNPLLTWCAANCVVHPYANGNRMLDKAKSTGRIDGIVAGVMAQGQMVQQSTPVGESFCEVW